MIAVGILLAVEFVECPFLKEDGDGRAIDGLICQVCVLVEAIKIVTMDHFFSRVWVVFTIEVYADCLGLVDWWPPTLLS
jgi:hypothetical protein